MKKKIGKRHSISLSLPGKLNRTRIKSITYTKQGILDEINWRVDRSYGTSTTLEHLFGWNIHPECEGEGVDFIDNTNSKGGEMIPRLCNYCDGKGNIDEDMVLDVNFDDDGKPHLIYKEI